MAEDTLPDPDSEPYWQGAATGELRYRRCTSCDAAIFYPRSLCSACGAPDPAWQVSAGLGTVYAVSVVHRAPPAFSGQAPYAVLLVDLDEGFRMMSRFVNGAPDTISVGDRVQVIFEDGPDGRPTPYFTSA
jgi:uncharacterized OB-fold protein